MIYDDLIMQNINKIKAVTKLKAFSPGSIARGILESYNDVASDIYNTLDLKIVNAEVSSAVGEYLDNIGHLVGVPRNGYSYALGQIKILIDPLLGKTLDDLKDIVEENTGVRPADIIIPAGTEVSNEDSSSVYNTISDIVLDDEYVYVDVLSLLIGTNGRISSGGISKFITFPPEYTSIYTYIIVTNPLPIDSGDDIETDDNYRFRIVNSFASNATSNDIAIRLAVLSVPGVADVFIKNYEYGIGTSGLFIVSESPIVSQGIINAVQQAVNNIGASGNRIIVSAPTYKAIDLEVVLNFVAGTSVANKDNICELVKSNVINYINNLEMGSEVVINELKEIIMSTSKSIYDLVINRIGIGDYNFQSGLIDYYQPVLPVNQSIGETEKFVSNKKLVNICYTE